MGVPGLASFIANRFRKGVIIHRDGKEDYSDLIKLPNKNDSTEVEDYETLKQTDYLYIDANSILHGYCQYVFKYGDKKFKNRVESKIDSLSFEKKIEFIYERFYFRIKSLANRTGASTILIAMDGVAPLCKQTQQRQRRFVSSPGVFDSNMISCGTEFMQNLTFYVLKALEKKDIKGRVIFSPHTYPGEAEHTIMTFIRKLPEKERKEKKHLFYSPDGDIIMLCLLSEIDKILIYKSELDIYGDDKLYVNTTITNMNGVRAEFLRTLVNNDRYFIENNIKFDDFENRLCIREFVLLGFLVGNDFLPRLQAFYDVEDGLDIILDTYKNFLKEQVPRRRLLTPSGDNINFENLVSFLKYLQKNEADYIYMRTKKVQKYNKKPIEVEEKLKDNLLHRFIVLDRLNYAHYMEAYKLKHNIRNPEKLAKDYLKGMYFVFKYYTHEIPCYKWRYEHHYPPFLFDLAQVRPKEIDTSFEQAPPTDAFIQLMHILPPWSANLLPPKLALYLTDPESPLAKYMPKKDEIIIDYEGRRAEHEGIVLLDFIDYKVYEDAYQEAVEKNGFKPSLYDRNRKTGMYMNSIR